MGESLTTSFSIDIIHISLEDEEEDADIIIEYLLL